VERRSGGRFFLRPRRPLRASLPRAHETLCWTKTSLTTGADSGPEWIARSFLYRTFIDSSPVSLAHALIHVDVYRTHHTGMVHRVVEEIFDRVGRRMQPKREQRALAGGRRAGRTTAPRNSGETHPSHRAINLFGAHFQTARFLEFFTGGT
jgi:hypothetical protein